MEKNNVNKKIIDVCNEVITKTENMHDFLRDRYTVVSDGRTCNGYEFFIGLFDTIRKMYTVNETVNPEAILCVLKNNTKIDMIIRYSSDSVSSNSYIIYTKEENGENWYEIDKNRRAILRSSIPTYTDTGLDMMMLILVNGLNIIIKEIEYVSDSDIIKWINSMNIDTKKFSKEDDKYIQYIYCKLVSEIGDDFNDC